MIYVVILFAAPMYAGNNFHEAIGAMARAIDDITFNDPEFIWTMNDCPYYVDVSHKEDEKPTSGKVNMYKIDGCNHAKFDDFETAYLQKMLELKANRLNISVKSA